MNFKFKKYLRDIERLRVGAYRDIKSGLFLDRNERVVPYDKKTLDLLCQRLAKCSFNLYPDVMPFYGKLTNWLKIDEKKIFLTEGTSGAIKALIEAIAHPGDNIIFPTPTFALYPIYCQMFGVKYRTVGYTKDYKLDLNKMLSLLNKRTSILFMPNPNVPIEGTLDLEIISLIARRCAKNKTFLAIDEVYFGFGGPTSIDLIDRLDNLFVMRSFSKTFGLPGIRLGYLLGSQKNIDYVSKTRTSYETNTASMEIASFFLDNYHLVKNYVNDVKEGLNFFKKELDKLGLEYNGGEASNFIYINLHDKLLTKKITKLLEAKKIFIRSNWPEPYSGGFCVTGAPKAIMEHFVSELSQILQRIK